MSTHEMLPDLPAGPVADRVSIWPLDDGRYGLDASFQGATGFERATGYQGDLREAGVNVKLIQELGGSWSLRFGPLTAHDVAGAMALFVR
jgi:hypothetical protein